MKTKLWLVTTWLWLLSLAILLTIYLAWLIYPLEVEWLKLGLQVVFPKEQLLKNYNVLLNYLTNPFVHHLSMPDFPSSKSGLKHFEDVKHLFHLTQVIFLVLLFPSWSFLKSSRVNRIFFLYQKFFTITAILPILIALLAILVGFDNFFTLFHQLLFPGDSSWLFNPATDPIIWVLPEEFFLHCFLIFFIIYELEMLVILILGRNQRLFLFEKVK